MQQHDADRTGYFSDAAFDIIVFASSAGGINALISVFSTLPQTFPSAIAVVQHLHPQYSSHLSEILAKKTRLMVKQVENGDIIHHSTIYIAPPDRHLLIRRNHKFFLSHAPAIKFLRPSANLLFISAAAVFKHRVIGVVLSGMGQDGAIGAQVIKNGHGTIIAQDEKTSRFFNMPNAAIQTGVVDFVLPITEIAARLVELVRLESKQ